MAPADALDWVVLLLAMAWSLYFLLSNLWSVIAEHLSKEKMLPVLAFIRCALSCSLVLEDFVLTDNSVCLWQCDALALGDRDEAPVLLGRCSFRTHECTRTFVFCTRSDRPSSIARVRNSSSSSQNALALFSRQQRSVRHATPTLALLCATHSSLSIPTDCSLTCGH